MEERILRSRLCTGTEFWEHVPRSTSPMHCVRSTLLAVTRRLRLALESNLGGGVLGKE